MLTQRELASNLGIARITAHYYENGKRTPSSKVMDKIHELYPQYLNAPDRREEMSTTDSRIITNQLDQIEKLQQDNNELKDYKRSRQLQDMANNSIGLDTWTIQTKVSWKGLSLEISIIDWGNTYDTVSKTLGYDDVFVKKLMSTSKYMLSNNIFKPILKEQTLKQFITISMRIPTILSNLIYGTYNLDVPMIYKHKNGSSVYAISTNSLDLQEKIVNTTVHFTSHSSL